MVEPFPSFHTNLRPPYEKRRGVHDAFSRRSGSTFIVVPVLEVIENGRPTLLPSHLDCRGWIGVTTMWAHIE
jgi:hypothetical protein